MCMCVAAVLLKEQGVKRLCQYLHSHPQISVAISLGQGSFCVQWTPASIETYNLSSVENK